jgi:hypothetical protein
MTAFRSLRCSVLALALGVSCSSTPGKHPAGQGTGQGPNQTIGQTTHSPAAHRARSRHPIIIATDRGIEEIDETGAIVRRISPTAARRPRFTGDDGLYFVAAGLAEIRRVGLDGKGERPVGMLSSTIAAQCNIAFPGPWDPARLLYSDADMVVDKSGDTVCLHLSDGQEDQSQASVWLRVALSLPGKGMGGIELICGSDPPDPKNGDLQCDPRPIDGGLDAQAGPLPDTGSPVELTAERESSSGRYALVSASVKRGRYRIRRILLLDRQSGAYYPIAPGPFAAPMDKRAWRALAKGQDITVRAARESDIRALARDDLFVVDSLLIAPGKRVVDTGGQFAR